MASHRIKDLKIPNLGGWHSPKPMHGTAYIIRHRLRSAIIMTLVAVVVFVSTAVGVGAYTLANAPTPIKPIIQPHGKEEKLVDPNAGKPIEFLVLGQDTRDGGDNATLGGTDEKGEHNADTSMVVQISADRSYINLVSIPRDSLVNAPSCQTSKGTVPARHNVMFNSIFAAGWNVGGDLASAASCTMNAVNALTGLKLEHFIVVDFQGLQGMINAIGGVNVCLPTDVKDSFTGLELKQGLQHLDGTQATEYARMRHGIGTDGSDIMRTARQQYLVKELLTEALSKNLLTNSAQLYRLANEALKSLSISSGLSNATTLAGLALSLHNMKPDHLYARTISVVPAPSDPKNRVVWASNADETWRTLREYKPLVQSDTPSHGTSGQAESQGATNQNQGATSQGQSSNGTQTQTQQGTLDPTTGLITTSDGRLIDPVTGGSVDKKNGMIRDPVTGQYMGVANQYLNATVCAVPAQK
ncbi:LCP family protein [Bifidobacterium sp. ESL0704]|uniref:LCP family protein n=1 Tax=Bifidobacterium sp. ESL0704 TaxID=2983219 RepID=UPI0023FA0875|nr:LCP family protein [Bifidobacterium sp. ESL0704]WEV52414.1 LCP family protein [Bifidobacterium sp. ESL0704]